MPGTCTTPEGAKIPAGSQQECSDQYGGKWEEFEDPGICPWVDIFVGAFADLLARLGGMYDIAVNVRDELLSTTTVGQEFLGLLDTHRLELVRLVRSDDRLLLSLVEAWVSVVPFTGQLALESQRSRGAIRSRRITKLRFSSANYQALSRVIDALYSGTRSTPFRRALKRLRSEVRPYVGLNPARALKRLRRSN
jgi:hypothetical protein